jgi:cyclophilin family peptidyl-prolyl cis-trans isomerase
MCLGASAGAHRRVVDSAAVSKSAKRERQRQNRQARREYEEAIAKRRRFWKSARNFAIILIPIAALFLFFALRGNNNDNSKSSAATNKTAEKLPAPSGVTIDPSKTYTATVDTSQGTFTITLDAANAPTSVNNFVYLAKAGYFDNRDIFRVANDLFQTGSGSAAGTPGYTVQAELPANGYQVGSVAWAKSGAEPAGTAGSQWFVVTGAPATSLPSDYGIIGQVTTGQDVLAKISALAPASGDGKPTKSVTVKKVTINES